MKLHTFDIISDYYSNFEKTDYTIVAEESIDDLVSLLLSCKEFSFDLETTGLDFTKDKILCIGFGLDEKVAVVIKWSDIVAEKLKPVFASETILKIGQNLKFDYKFLRQAGIKVNAPIFDTLIAATIINENLPCDLLTLSYAYISKFAKPIEAKKNLWHIVFNCTNWEKIPIELLCEYCAEDNDYTFRLKQIFQQKLKDLNLQLCFQIDMDLLVVLAEMEYFGMRVDLSKLEKVRDSLTNLKISLTKELLAEIKDVIPVSNNSSDFWYNRDINFGSSKQVSTILFSWLKLPVINTSIKTGHASTDMKVLEKLQDKHKFVRLLIKYREIDKLLNTYVDKFPNVLDMNSRVHCQFQQHRTVTGRLSCVNPNLQAIPAETNIIRELFVADPGYILYIADYSQLELKVLAFYTQDASMLDAYNKGIDIHTKTGAALFNTTISNVTKEQRGIGKLINFGIVYGMSVAGIAAATKYSIRKAQEFLDLYFETYPGVKIWRDNVIRELYEKYEVRTIFDRVRHFTREELLQDNKKAARIERQAVNAIIQSSAAYLVKLVMIKIYNYFQAMNINANLCLQVHDELIIQIPIEKAEELREKLIQLMIEPPFKAWNIPLEVTAFLSPYWIKGE